MGTAGKSIRSVNSLTADSSGNLDNTQGKFNGIRFYNKSSTDPISPTPADGDRYYNTAMHLEMVYDESRAKWLSNESNMLYWSRNGNTAQGSYFQGQDGIAFTSIKGFLAPFSGTLVAVGYSRDDSDSAVFELTSNGTEIGFLSSSAQTGADYNINSNFNANSILGARNKTGGNTVTDVQGWARIRWRR